MTDNLTQLIQLPTDRFEIFSMDTELVRAYEDPGTKKKMFKGIASSTTKDLHGDTITLSALQDMERQAVGLTMFLNHSYDVPDDVGGTITKAIIKQKGADHNGDPMYVLEIEGEVEEDNEDALKTWKFVQKGRKIGLSIGAMIPAKGATRQKDGSYIIEHLDLLEVSFVGIPANPKSWVEYAASALRGLEIKSRTAEIGNPTLSIDGDTYRIEGSMKGLKLVQDGVEPEVIETPIVIDYHFARAVDGKTIITRSATTPEDADGMVEAEVVTLGAWDLSDNDERLVAIATINEEVIAKATVWVETRDGDTITIGEPPAAVEDSTDPEITKAKNKTPCPECGKTDCDSDGDLHGAAPEPDVQDAKIRVIEVDTDAPASGDGNQGASASEPDDADETYAAPEADITADGEASILDELPEDQLVQLSFAQLQQVALRATTELVEAKKALGEEKTARLAAEAQRDEVALAAEELVKRTAEIIEKVANAPLPRKAVLKGIEAEFSTSVEAYYGTAFARALAAGK